MNKLNMYWLVTAWPAWRTQFCDQFDPRTPTSSSSSFLV